MDGTRCPGRGEEEEQPGLVRPLLARVGTGSGGPGSDIMGSPLPVWPTAGAARNAATGESAFASPRDQPVLSAPTLSPTTRHELCPQKCGARQIFWELQANCVGW